MNVRGHLQHHGPLLDSVAGGDMFDEFMSQKFDQKNNKNKPNLYGTLSDEESMSCMQASSRMNE